MRAVAYKQPQPISAETSLIDIELPMPEAEGHDLLVEVKAVSVNPVDVKVRSNVAPPEGEYKVIGWDAAGIVKAVGPDVTIFKPGDEVFYAGAINRGGSNAEFHLVDERIVGTKPKSLDFPAAAALPLTSITAYETLFDRLKVQDPVPGVANAILIIGGAGGVGSIAIQIARADRSDHYRHGIPAGNASLGEGIGRPSRDRPFETDCAADRGARDRRAGFRLLDDQHV